VADTPPIPFRLAGMAKSRGTRMKEDSEFALHLVPEREIEPVIPLPLGPEIVTNQAEEEIDKVEHFRGR
jgi:hypothetical protein